MEQDVCDVQFILRSPASPNPDVLTLPPNVDFLNADSRDNVRSDIGAPEAQSEI
jgi:hypothetical protein